MRSNLVRVTVVLTFVGALSFMGCGSDSDNGGGSPGGKKPGRLFADSVDLMLGGQPSQGYMFGASFGVPTGCSNARQVDSCEVQECPSPNTQPTPDTSVHPHAGDMTLTGGAQSLSLEPDDKGRYEPVMENGLLWKGGETLSFSAKGGEVPAFAATLKAPEKLTVTAPVAKWNMVEHTKGTPLQFTWTGGAGGTVVIEVRALTVAGERVAQCSHPASKGTAELSEAIWSEFSAGGRVSVAVRNHTVVTAGEYEVTVQATTPSVDAEGAEFNYQVVEP